MEDFFLEKLDDNYLLLVEFLSIGFRNTVVLN